VLSHADSRARYDARGKEGLEEVNFMEASTFYQARCRGDKGRYRRDVEEVNFMEASTFYQVS